jgi:Glyoxalase/Bleomycin resistance protein/Dioxygenase superfamily
MITPENLFHVGLVVTDFEKARAELGAQGYDWAPTLSAPLNVLGPDDTPRTVPGTLTYSLEPLRIELLLAGDGTPWPPSEAGSVHHLGYWVDDLGSATEHAAAQGWTRGWAGSDEDGRAARFAYYTLPATAVRVELVDRSAIGESLERWWGGGSYTR